MIPIAFELQCTQWTTSAILCIQEFLTCDALMWLQKQLLC